MNPTPASPTTDPLAPIQALPNVAPLTEVAPALQEAFAVIRSHVKSVLMREIVQRNIIELLDRKRIDGATRLVQMAAAESRALEEKSAPSAIEGGGTPMEFSDPEPWPEPVDGAAWLDAVMALFRKHLILPDQAAEAIALWIMQTYALEASDIAPMLAVVSPEKRCGKSRLLSLLSYLCRRPLAASSITGSVIFRVVEQWSPTLVIDEADTFLSDNESLRGIINSGHTRPMARVLRSVGESHEPRWFSTWGAKVIARIGKFKGAWETVSDRSIVVPMRRRAEGEQIDRAFPKVTPAIEVLNRQAVRWSQDHMDQLRAIVPAEREGLDDRAADNWRPLFAIAELVGAGWPEKATRAALTLSGAKERESSTAGVLLLEDIRKYFGPGGPGVDRVATIDLADWLATSPDLAERPWRTFRHGKPVSPKSVGNLLEPYGIKPDRWWEGTRPKRIQVRGFCREAFADAWGRYLPTPAEGEEAEAA